jgi:hypothetical protein
MRSLILSVEFLSAASAAFAQQWEFGAEGGGSLLSNVSVSGAGKATAGFAPGAAFGVFVGENLYSHLTGELHYEFLQSDPRISSAGQTTSPFSGVTHALHFDMVYHTNRKESRTQFFASVGGGVKVFEGTGAPQAYQALSQFGYLTKAQDVKPMVSVGGGLTYQLAPRIFLRAEIRDFISAFPTQVIAPAPGMKFGSLLNDIVPLVGITYIH